MMGNKKKRYSSPNTTKHQNPLPPVTVPDLQADEDPYWQVSPDHAETRNFDRLLEKFQRSTLRYPQWADDLMCGVPSYYCVLNVLRGASSEQLLQHYEQENDFSYFSDETIEEAYDVLSNTMNRVKYDEFLRLFMTLSHSLPQEKKTELIDIHRSNVEKAKIFRRFSKIKITYGDYVLLVAKGMPDIFTYAGLSRDCSEEDIQKFADRGDEVSGVIALLMREPAKRDDFKFISDFPDIVSNEEGKKVRKKLKKVWKTFDPLLISRVMLMTLTASNQYVDILNRCGEILQENHDWIPFLPPSNETFFSLLGVDEDVGSLQKSEIETLLRSRYRELERTPRINLAYTVLKNQKLREDYLWMQKHYEFKKLDDALTVPIRKPSQKNEMEEMQKMIRKLLRNIRL